MASLMLLLNLKVEGLEMFRYAKFRGEVKPMALLFDLFCHYITGERANLMRNILIAILLFHVSVGISRSL
jgi:hypothetical protein